MEINLKPISKQEPKETMNVFNRVKELCLLYTEHNRKHIENETLFKLINFVEKEELLFLTNKEEFKIASKWHEYLIKHKSFHILTRNRT